MISISNYISPQTINALYKQENYLKNNPINGINYHFNDNDITDIQADIEGPVSTPYEGGIFRVKIKIPPDFPKIAPKGIFLTKIYHPNISEQGEVCVNTLKRDWDPKNWSLINLFQVIRCLLIIPFPQSALNEEAGKLFMEDYEQFFKIAKLYTSIHACLNNKKNNEKKDEEDQKITSDIYCTPVKKKKMFEYEEYDEEIDENINREDNIKKIARNLNESKEFKINS